MRFLHLVSFILLLILPAGVHAQESDPFRTTEYPVPRFVSLRADKVYARTGPGTRYPIRWVYQKQGMPVEIVLEYDTWRKIKDIDGDEGWVHQSLLSGARTGIVKSEENLPLYRKPDTESHILAYAQPEAIIGIEECGTQWCLIDAEGYKGWADKNRLWGVYGEEIFD